MPVGLISWLEIVQYYGQLARKQNSQQTTSDTDLVVVSAVMVIDPPTVSPDTPVSTAIDMMRDKELDSLLVVSDDRLVGIVTQYDIFNITARLLQTETDQAPHSRES